MASQLRTPSPRDRAGEGEWAIRQDLACAYRLVHAFGWDDLVFTHISARLPGPEHQFLINDYRCMFDEITASNLVKIDVEGRAVDAQTGAITNPAGFTIHSALHMARPDAHAVMHLHTTAGLAVAAQRDGLMPLTQTAMLVRGSLAYHDYEGVATDLDERERIVADMGTANALILRNHGILTVGRTIGEAFVTMHFLQRACEAQIMALSAGRDGVLAPPDGMAERADAQGRAGLATAANLLAWPALRRRMDRLDPSYRD